MARAARCKTIDTTGAPLHEEFGYNLAVKWFGQEAVDSLPEYIRGKNKGKKKGFIRWRKVTSAGYETGHGRYFGENDIIWGWIGKTMFSPSNEAAPGRWMGRVQSLSGSKFMLNEAARERDAAERAAEKAERDARYQEALDSVPEDEREAWIAKRQEFRSKLNAETEAAQAQALRW